jgi:hypothetical protein
MSLNPFKAVCVPVQTGENEGRKPLTERKTKKMTDTILLPGSQSDAVEIGKRLALMISTLEENTTDHKVVSLSISANSITVSMTAFGTISGPDAEFMSLRNESLSLQNKT